MAINCSRGAAWLGVAVSIAVASLAFAQGLPRGPIVVTSPYQGGGSSDFALRAIFRKAETIEANTFILEGKSGGAGAVAAAHVKSGRADGTALMLADSGTFTYSVTINPKLTYDPVKDFKPVALLFSIPNVLAVPADLPVNSINELLAYGKSKPGGLTYASPSVASTGHLLGSRLAHIAGQPMLHVPYRTGSAAATTDLVAGRVDFFFNSYPVFRSLVGGGKLKLLATSGKARDVNLPNVPTVAEAGFPQLELEIWFGLVAPKDTPDSTVEALNALFGKTLEYPDLVASLRDQSFNILKGTPQQFSAQISADIIKYKPLILEAGVQMN